jgi:hypothetical protein
MLELAPFQGFIEWVSDKADPTGDAGGRIACAIITE